MIPSAFAGWEVTENTRTSAGSTTSTYQFQREVVKYITENIQLTIHIKESRMILANTATKLYWEGTVNEFKKQVSSGIDAETQNMLNSMSPEDKVRYMKMMDELRSAPAEPEAEKIPIQVKATAAVEKIAGINASKYDILQKDRIIEELWIAQTFTLRGEVDIQRMSDMLNSVLGSIGRGSFYSADYIDLLKKGYPMRSIKHIPTGAIFSEVSKVEQKEIPSSSFDAPKAYKTAGLNEVLAGN
jgi:hypothetical protein